MRYILFLILIFAVSCSDNNPLLSRLDHIDSIIDENPQAAYDSLCTIKKTQNITSAKNVNMKWHMLMATAQNKLYMQMPTDSAFSEVVAYYDRNGSDNEKMQSRYLLGCIYRDMNDAPKAIECYKKAITYVDTLDSRCNYTALSRIYGQMSDVYSLQYLNKEARQASINSGVYALKAGNIRSYIIGYEAEAYACLADGDTASAIRLAKKCMRLYKDYKFTKESVTILPVFIYVYIGRHQFDHAHELIEKYINNSGVFNSDSTIKTGYEHFYKALGMYYSGINKLDSANIFYRKLDTAGYHLEAYSGLMEVYSKIGNIDSLAKYSRLNAEEYARTLQQLQANATMQAAATFDYNRFVKIVDDNERRAERMIWCFCFLILVVFVIGLIIYKRNRMQHLKDVQELILKNEKYIQTCNLLEQTKEELHMLKEDYKPVVSSLEYKVSELENEKEMLLASTKNVDVVTSMSAIKSSDVYKLFKDKTNPSSKSTMPSETQWMLLEEQVRYIFPEFYSKVADINKLSCREKRISILTFLSFSSSEIIILLQTTSQIVTNAKRSINTKLFNEESAKNLYRNLKKLI